MSRRRFKITIQYDSNEGYTGKDIIYCLQNNSSDYRYFLDEKGNFIECYGTDSYCDYLVYALKLETFIDKVFTDGVWWGCIVEEIGFSELPELIKEKYNRG